MPNLPDTDHDGEEFFEALAGRSSSLPGAAALREALLEEAAATRLDGANSSGHGVLTPEQSAQYEALRARLVNAGVLGAPIPAQKQPAGAVAGHSLGHLVRRWFETFKARPWPPMAAMAASALLGLAVMMNLPLGSDPADSPDAIRGAPGASVVFVSDPAEFVQHLKNRVMAVGGEVELVQINPQEWALSIKVEQPTTLPAVQSVLKAAGFEVTGQPPYELSVKLARR